MLVDRTDAEIASAGISDAGSPEAAELGAEKIIRAAELSHERVLGHAALDVGTVDLDRRLRQIADTGSDAAKDIEAVPDVADARDVLYDTLVTNKNTRVDYGEGGVLRAADLNASAKGMPASYEYLFHSE